MRVLFITNSGDGQLNPMVPTAWAFQAAGDQVLIAAPEDFLPRVARTGLQAASSSEPVDLAEIMMRSFGGSLLPTEMPWEDQVRAASRGFAAVADRTVDGTTALARAWRPDLIVGEPTAFSAPLAAARAGLPFVEHRVGPAMPALLRRLVAEELGRELPDPELIIDNCPPGFQHDDVPAGIVVRYVPYNGPCDLADWMMERGERRRVCLTLGGGLPHDPGSWSLLEIMAAALDELSVEMVLAVPNPDEAAAPRLKGLPSSVRAVGRFPLSATLPTCDLVINHGGAGSVMATLVNGLPQLAVPHYGDDFLTATRVQETGVGLTFPATVVSAEAVKAAASALLDEPGYRDKAQAIADENSRQLSLPMLVEILRARVGQ